MTRTLNIAAGGDAAPETVDHAQYIDLLSAVPVFASLPHEALADLVGLATEECFVAGAIVVAEGEIGDRLYVIAQGEVEVTIARPTGPVPLTKLGPGEQFGELALILPGGRRRATVT